MNPYLEPQGFLGTGASLLADLTLLAYLLLIVPAMLIGWLYARRKLHRPHHKWLMIGVTVINWVLIGLLMLVAYRFDIADNIGAQPNNPRYLLPTLHALFGLPAQLLATFIVLRMLVEDAQVARAKARGETGLSKYWFRHAKSTMFLTLALWLITAALGVVSYVTRYEVLPTLAQRVGIVAPVVTPEVEGPAVTPEIAGPAVTPEVNEPAATPEIGAPLATEEFGGAALARTPLPPAVTEAAS